MTRYAAFLRGINLGNRRIKMDELREHLDSLGLDGVATYIASGNVVFDEKGADPGELEFRIEGHLEEVLGYPVDTFVRELTDLGSILENEAVRSADDDFKAHVVFLKEPVASGGDAALRELESPDDRFHLLGREIVWLRRGGLSDAPITGRQIEGAAGADTSTMRTVNTLRRMSKKFL